MDEKKAPQKQASKLKTKKKTDAASKAKKEIEILKLQNSSLQDQFLRKAAEFDNYKKRTQREISEIIINANENLIKSLLPVLDDLERSLETQKDNDSAFIDGIQLIYSKLIKLLYDMGLKKIEAIGKKFDVEKHDAILQMKNKKYKKNDIIEEYEKGYELNGKIIRHSKVVVSK